MNLTTLLPCKAKKIERLKMRSKNVRDVFLALLILFSIDGNRCVQ